MCPGNTMRIVIALLLVMLLDISVARGEESVTLGTLKAQLARLQAQILRLEKQQQQQKKLMIQSQSKKTEPVQTVAETHQPKLLNNTFRAYATIRPTFGYIQQQGERTTDVRDALSHLGFKASRKIKPGWTAEMQGEWGIDLSNSGDFGKSRRAYVALDSPYGRMGIGKQRPPQYLLIAEYVDIFNHAASPFSYDPQSLFFVDNLLTYSKKKWGCYLDGGGQIRRSGGGCSQ